MIGYMLVFIGTSTLIGLYISSLNSPPSRQLYWIVGITIGIWCTTLLWLWLSL